MTETVDAEAAEAAREAEAAKEKGRLLFARECLFLRGAATLDDIPPGPLPEIAFAGRSNAGKSSLLNALTGRKTLARVSNTPGRTREINFFELGEKLMLADLPGYGYARVSKADSRRWTDLIFAYLRGRANLRRVALLIDSRRGLLPNDTETMELMDKAAVSYQIVLTKTDKLKPNELQRIERETLAASTRHGAAYPGIIATSSLTGEGMQDLRAALAFFA